MHPEIEPSNKAKTGQKGEIDNLNIIVEDFNIQLSITKKTIRSTRKQKT